MEEVACLNGTVQNVIEPNWYSLEISVPSQVKPTERSVNCGW